MISSVYERIFNMNNDANELQNNNLAEDISDDSLNNTQNNEVYNQNLNDCILATLSDMCSWKEWD